MHKSSDDFKEQKSAISRFVTVIKTDRKIHSCSGMHDLFRWSGLVGLDLLVTDLDCNHPAGFALKRSIMIAAQSLNQGIKGTNSALLAENKKGHLVLGDA